MLKNYYSNDLYPIITASEFDDDDKKTAANVFSKCHMALLYYIIIMTIAIIVIDLVLQLVYPEDTYMSIIMHPTFSPALQIVSMYFIAFPFYCIFLRKVPKASREKSTIPLCEFISLASISIAVMQLGSIVAELAKRYISSSLQLPYAIEMTNSLLQAFDVVPTLIWVIIIGPIFEELIFRKVMIDRLSVYGDRLAVIVSSVAFGLFHGNLTQFIYTTLAGFFFGHAYTKTRRLIYPIGLHMLANLFGTLPTVLYYIEFNATQEDIVDVEAIFNGGITLTYIMFWLKIVLIAWGIVMFVFSFFMKKYRLSKLCDIEIPKLKLLRVVVFNKGTILFFVYSVLNIVLTFLELGQ